MKIILTFSGGARAVVDRDGTIHTESPACKQVVEYFMTLHPERDYLPHPWMAMAEEMERSGLIVSWEISGVQQESESGEQPLIH